MAKRRYALERGGPKRLEVRWRRGLRDMEVLFDGATVGSVDRSAMELGAGLRLPDGTTLLLQWIPRPWWSIAMSGELRVERQGVPVPGSDGDLRTIGRRAARLLALLGLAQLAVAAVWAIFARGGGSTLAALEALVLLVLGVLTAFGLRFPIALGAVVLVADPLFLLGVGASLNPAGLVVRTLIVVHLIRAWRRTGTKTHPSEGPALSA